MLWQQAEQLLRSWFDTSPWTQIRGVTERGLRSPWGIEGWTEKFYGV